MGRDAGPGAAGGEGAAAALAGRPRAELRASVAAGPRRQALARANVGGQGAGRWACGTGLR